MRISLIVLVIFFLANLRSEAGDFNVRLDRNIAVTKLTTDVYLVKSSFSGNGQLDCNHLIVLDNKEMLLINTPATDSLTRIMIQCLETRFKRKITKLIVSHFHDDSAGGLHETVRQGIKSYGMNLTNNLLKPAKKKLDIVFSDSMSITLPTIKLNLFYFGPGHSIDNIVTWIPSEKILFGGCLLKSMDTDNIGNIKDADIQSWPVTVQKIKARFREAKIVIPGHLAIGDLSLFDHTLKIINGNKQ